MVGMLARPSFDPFAPTNLNRTKAEREAFLLFCAMVPGKKAEETKRKLDHILEELDVSEADTPFDILRRNMDDAQDLFAFLTRHRTGQYTRLIKCLRQMMHLNVMGSLDRNKLEQIIGRKSACFYLLHTHGQRVAVLDVHVLNFIQCHLGIDAPSSTPSSTKLYRRLEDIFLNAMDSAGLSPIDGDFAVWVLGKINGSSREQVEAFMETSLWHKALRDIDTLTACFPRLSDIV